MADFSTIICDYKGCGAHGATRYHIPLIALERCPATGESDMIGGDIDLCHKHTGILVTAFISGLDLTMEQRNKVYQTLKSYTK